MRDAVVAISLRKDVFQMCNVTMRSAKCLMAGHAMFLAFGGQVL